MSDIVEDVKRTPMQHRQKIYFVILGLVLLASGFGLGASSTFFYLKDRIRPKPFVIFQIAIMRIWSTIIFCKRDRIVSRCSIS